MSVDVFADVQEFCRQFKIPQRKPGEPADVPLLHFRVSCLLEELTELSIAMNCQDWNAVTDALVDLVYYALGTGYILNLPVYGAWKAVHGANLQKTLAPADPSLRQLGIKLNVTKPAGWKHPDHTHLLNIADRPRGEGK